MFEPNATYGKDLDKDKGQMDLNQIVQITINFDIGCKMFQKLQVIEDNMASDICKQLKQKLPSNNSFASSSNASISLRDKPQASSNSRLSVKQQPEKDLGLNNREEYGLYMINMKASSPILFIRKFHPNDYVLKIYLKSLILFKKDGDDRFKLFYLKNSDIEQYLRSKGVFQSQFDEENQVVSQLGKSIINNKTYERKGNLQKKSLNSDKFKERKFVLDKD